jgi:uncharacterized protein (DUF1499 family)
LAIVVGLPVVFLIVLRLTSRTPQGLGVTGGRLADCPGTPNCVSSQATREASRVAAVRFRGSHYAARERAEAILRDWPRTRIVEADEHYMHAECTSLIFRFVDDFEVLVEVDTQEIHVRSASRVGYSDLGANRRRIEDFRREFERRQ